MRQPTPPIPTPAPDDCAEVACLERATVTTVDGVPLCQGCYDALVEFADGEGLVEVTP